MSKTNGPRDNMETSALGIHEVGAITVMKLAFAKRPEPVIGSSLSEKFFKLPSGKIRSAGVRPITAGTFVCVTIAVDAAQQVLFVGCGINGIV